MNNTLSTLGKPGAAVLTMPETAKRRANESAAGSVAAAAGASKKVKGAGPGGLCATPATAGIHGCAVLPGDVLMPWVGLGTYKVRNHRAAQGDPALLLARSLDRRLRSHTVQGSEGCTTVHWARSGAWIPCYRHRFHLQQPEDRTSSRRVSQCNARPFARFLPFFS